MQSKLYAIRKTKFKKSQKEVADYLGISKEGYRLKEIGSNPFTLNEMFAISKLFDMPIEEIFIPVKKEEEK